MSVDVLIIGCRERALLAGNKPSQKPGDNPHALSINEVAVQQLKSYYTDGFGDSLNNSQR